MYLVSQVSCKVVVLPGEVLIIQLSYAGSQDMFTAEEWVMGEDQARNINVELVVSFRVRCTANIQICIL